MPPSPDDHPLLPWLDLAVPLAQLDLRQRGGPTEADVEEARAFSDVLSERGDVLLFGGRVRAGQDGPGALAARLSRAVAVLAWVSDGGVEVFGRRWTREG